VQHSARQARRLVPPEQRWCCPVRRVRPEVARRCGPEAAALSARPLPAAWWALHPARWGHLRSAQQKAARRDGPAVWSEHPHSAAPPVRRGAAVRSCCRRVVAGAQRPAVLPGQVWSRELLCQAPAAAFHQREGAVAAQAMALPSGMKAAAVEAVMEPSVRPVASARWARRPAEEAAAASGAKVQPPGVAEAE
jgi:hypothetical protein